VTVRGLSFGLARAYEIARDLHHYRLFVGATRQP